MKHFQITAFLSATIDAFELKLKETFRVKWSTDKNHLFCGMAFFWAVFL